MADSFFGFDNTSLQGDEECSDDLEENNEDYDALNNETFGETNADSVGDDWRIHHEQFSGILESSRRSHTLVSGDVQENDQDYDALNNETFGETNADSFNDDWRTHHEQFSGILQSSRRRHTLEIPWKKVAEDLHKLIVDTSNQDNVRATIVKPPENQTGSSTYGSPLPTNILTVEELERSLQANRNEVQQNPSFPPNFMPVANSNRNEVQQNPSFPPNFMQIHHQMKLSARFPPELNPMLLSHPYMPPPGFGVPWGLWSRSPKLMQPIMFRGKYLPVNMPPSGFGAQQSANIRTPPGFRAQHSHNIRPAPAFGAQHTHNIRPPPGFGAQHSNNIRPPAEFGAQHSHNIRPAPAFGAQHTHNIRPPPGFGAQHSNNIRPPAEFGAQHSQNITPPPGFGAQPSNNITLTPYFGAQHSNNIRPLPGFEAQHSNNIRPPAEFGAQHSHNITPPPGFGAQHTNNIRPLPGFEAQHSNNIRPPAEFGAQHSHNITPPPGFGAKHTNNIRPLPGFEAQHSNNIRPPPTFGAQHSNNIRPSPEFEAQHSNNIRPPAEFGAQHSHNITPPAGFEAQHSNNIRPPPGFEAQHSNNIRPPAEFGAQHSHNITPPPGFGTQHINNIRPPLGFEAQNSPNIIPQPEIASQYSANRVRFVTLPLLMQHEVSISAHEVSISAHESSTGSVPRPSINIRQNMDEIQIQVNTRLPNRNFPSPHTNYEHFRPELPTQNFQPNNLVRSPGHQQEQHPSDFNAQNCFNYYPHQQQNQTGEPENNFPQINSPQQIQQKLNQRTEPEDHDEYSGLMTTCEKQELINILTSQLNIGIPYFDDFYYTTFMDRQNQNRPRTTQHSTTNLYHNNNRHQSYRNDDYNKDEFENSLGKLQCYPLPTPRKTIEVDVHSHEKTGANQSFSRRLRETKETLLELETLFGLVLRLEDLNYLATAEEKDKILEQLQDDSLVKNDNKEDLLNKIFNGLVDDDKFSVYVGVRKGKLLLLRILPHFKNYADKYLQIWMKLLASIPLAGRKDELSDYIFPQFFPSFARFVDQLCMDSILKITSVFTIIRTENAGFISSENHSLGLVLCNKLGISCITKMIERSETLLATLQVTETMEEYHQWYQFLSSISKFIENVEFKINMPMKPLDGFIMEMHLKRSQIITPNQYSRFFKVFCKA